MKQKHLALALSAVFAATALAGCGSDGDSPYNAPTPETPTPTPTPETPTPTPTPETPTPTPTPETPTPTPEGPSDNEDNVGGAANPGNQAKEPSVVGQQYVRGSSAKFDKTPTTNKDAANTGNATVVGFEKLQNEKMTNIVVAQFADESNKDANGKPNPVKYLLGAIPSSNPQVTDPNSLQRRNDATLNGESLGAIVRTEKTQEGASATKYKITGQESVVGNNSNITQVAPTFTSTPATDTDAAVMGNDVRIFGALSTTATAEEIAADGFFNSQRYLVKDAEGNAIALKMTPPADPAAPDARNTFKNEGLKLNNVQYGRVTGALDNLKAEQIKGQNYVSADFADKNFAGNTTQTDVYFYRGVGETTLAQMAAVQTKGGVFQYAGHALMYGIDNSYNGDQDTGGSNSVAFGNTGVGIGNFVQAQYDAGNGTVAGSVYNIWDKGAEDGSATQVDLVKFNGDVLGNSIVNGTADRTYITGNDKAAFKGSFFGNAAQELGGSFNSITTGYDKSQWGGVFGAQQLPKVPGQEPEAPGLPPIAGVE